MAFVRDQRRKCPCFAKAATLLFIFSIIFGGIQSVEGVICNDCRGPIDKCNGIWKEEKECPQEQICYLSLLTPEFGDVIVTQMCHRPYERKSGKAEVPDKNATIEMCTCNMDGCNTDMETCQAEGCLKYNTLIP